MTLKISLLLALSISIFTSVTQASNTSALTSIECFGDGQYFQTQFAQNQTGHFQVPFKFEDSNIFSEQIQMMDIDVIITPAGSFSSKMEVRVYKGYYIKADLRIGFDISQELDTEGTLVKYLKNIFVLNQRPVGNCIVTQGY